MSRWTVGASLVNVSHLGTLKWTQPFLSNRTHARTDGHTDHYRAPAFCGALMNKKHINIFTMVSYFLRWTLLKIFSSFPDEQSQQKVRQLGRITCAVINTSNEVKSPLLWEFWIFNFSLRILERSWVGSIVNIRNECLFFWVHGEWIEARNKRIGREPLRGSRDLRFIPHKPRKKDTRPSIKIIRWSLVILVRGMRVWR